MAKVDIEASKRFDPAVESFLAKTSTALELLECWWIMRVRSTDNARLAAVPIVTNNPLAIGDLVHQALLPKHSYIIRRTRVRSIHPNDSILKYWKTNLVGETSLFELVRVGFWVLGKSWMNFLEDTAMHPIYTDDKDNILFIFIIRIPSLGPKNLCMLRKNRSKWAFDTWCNMRGYRLELTFCPFSAWILQA